MIPIVSSSKTNETNPRYKMPKTSFCWVEALLSRTDASEPSGESTVMQGQRWCSHSRPTLVAPRTAACQAPQFTGFPRQEHWGARPKIFELASRSAKLKLDFSKMGFFLKYKKLFFKKFDLSYFQKNDLKAISIQNLHKNFSIQPCN